MTTDLNLTIAQQNEIRPLLEAQIIDKKMMDDKKKEQNKSGKKPSKEAQKKLKKIKKAKKTAMNVKMASILDKAQLIKYHLLKEAIKKKKEMDSKKKKDN
ncbi:hypothetical protein [Polaribacter glomeratus]|nr:hypothetical protein [Polaribacter glomeratus]